MGTRPKSPSFFGETSSFFVRFNLTSFAQYLRAVETRGGVAQACRAAPLGNGKARKSRLTVPRVTFGCGTVRRHRSRGARRRPLLLSLEGFRGSVAWSCGHYIGHYIRHIRLIFGNFYYCCPEACHTASHPVPVTQGRSGIQTERVTDGRQVIYQSIAELIGLTRL